MAKKAYIGVGNTETFESRELPTGYKQLAYIESTGTQYINTGITGESSLDKVIELDHEYTDVSSTQIIIGSWKNSSTRFYPISTAGYFGYGSNVSVSSVITYTANTRYQIRARMHKYDQYLIVNDETIYQVPISTTAVDTGLSMYLFAVNYAGSASNYAKAKVRSCKITNNGSLARDFVPCRNTSGEAGMYDLVGGKFYGNAGTGNFIGSDESFARQIKKMYVGVDGFARRIKKAYIGIGGVARPWFSGEELTYYGKITDLTAARKSLAATTVGNYALFGGGDDDSTYCTTVDAYNKTLTRTTPTAFAQGRYELAATTVGNRALFGGGHSFSVYSTVDIYDTSTTRLTPIDLSSARYGLSATTVGNYALFGGGSGTSNYAKVDAFNASLTRTTPTALSSSRKSLAATTVGNYALFGGGNKSTKENDSSETTIVDAYDTSLTRTTPTALSLSRDRLAATSVGNYALFGGGWWSDISNTVDAYDTSLTRTTPTTLSVARDNLAATTVGGYALFGGGNKQYDGYGETSVIDAYDTSLTRTTPTALSSSRDKLAATTVGGYALFGGGVEYSWDGSYIYKNRVDAYTVG